MSVEEAKRSHRAVAEAGFGSAMVGLGFKPVSKTQWKREGDGVTWRLALGQASGYWPGYIAAHYGLQLHGFDELSARVWDYKPSRRLGGTSARVHYADCIEHDVIMALQAEHRRQYPKRTGFRGWLADRMHGPHPTFRENMPPIPFMEFPGIGDTAYGEAWTFEGRDPADLATALAQHFERLTLPQMNAMNDAWTYYETWWGPDSYEKGSFKDWNRYVIAKLVGDTELLDWMAGQIIEDGMKSYEQHYAELKEDDKIGRKKRNPDKDYTLDEAAAVSRLSAIGWCETLLEVAQNLDFKVSDPGLRFDLRDRAESELGSRRAPTLDKVRDLRRRGVDWVSRYR